ncbi:MAG: hypothetical protein ACTTGU_05190 [Moraxella sp.]
MYLVNLGFFKVDGCWIYFKNS